jgi:glycosyltransferase involved in cell wall biosynthesis
MKIGLDVAQTCTPRAGCAWYADSLTRAMVKLAPEDYFFLYHQFGTHINSDTTTGTMIVAPNVTPTFTDVTPAEASRIWGSPRELLIKTGAPDIVHAMSFRAPRVPGAKLVFTVYDVSFWAVHEFSTEENRLLCQHGLLEALSNADGFIFISQSSRDEFERFLPGWLELNRKPAIITHLGPRDERISKPTQTDHSDYWLAVGSLEPRKNYETLLDALELYWKQSANPRPLKIAGGLGWKSSQLKKRIDDLGGQGIVQYLGYVPDHELPALYSGAEALLFPAWYEGFGLPVLEAMTQGCPVISSDRTSLREIGGNAALYIDPANPQQIASTMIQLEADKVRRKQLVQTSLKQAAKFSWERTAQQTLQFYQLLLNSASSHD